MRRDIIYSISCLAFAIMIGGAVYEHLTVVPQWSAAPPVSLSMFQGEYGLNPELFWMSIHPVNIILFAATLIIHWKTKRRKNVLITLISYFIILIITSIYFVPELLSITSTTYASAPDSDLTQRAKLWEILSLARLGVLMVLSIILFTGLTKQVNKLVTEGTKAY